MKRTAKLLSIMLVLACLLTCLPILSASAVPTTATVTTDKTSYAVDETITFTMSSNGTSNTLWVYRVDGQWTNYYQNAGTTMTLAFGWAGEYSALVEAWDGTGSLCSSMIYFTVGGSASSGSAPTSATIGADKSVYKLGDFVNFTMSGDGESNTLWIYKPDGTSEYFQNAGTAYSYIPTQAGQYEALMETWNGVGSFCSEKIKFRVVDPNATTTKPTTTKPTTQSTTQSTTTKPTTQSTTQSTTTKPTTQPTTVSTTQPTTVTTTKPTTVPTQNTNPCAKGHKYQNGYCIYCAKKDPNWYPCINGHTYENGWCIYCLDQDVTYDPCAGGHTYENGWCVFCLDPDPENPCARGEHNYVGGSCTGCFGIDPNYQDPCAAGHDLDETGSCKNCNYYDPDFNPDATQPTQSTDPADKNAGKDGSKKGGDDNFWLWFWIVLVLFLVFIVLAVVLIVKKNKSSGTPDDAPAAE